jgi:hypothetical protein
MHVGAMAFDDLEVASDCDLFEMANLYPRDTGLDVTIWVSPRGHARHDARIKVRMSPGDRMDADNTATVAVRPQPRVQHGILSKEDENAVSRWIGLNEAALVGYRDGALSTVEFVQKLVRLP